MKSAEIDLLVQLLSSLQGIGPRSANRIILQLIQKKEKLMIPLATILNELSKKVYECDNCGNYDTSSLCYICVNQSRDRNTLCVVEQVADLWAMERGHLFKGVYHVLGGTLNAISGYTPEKLNIEKLYSRIKDNKINEVILATSVTTMGQATAHYLTDSIKKMNVKVTRLARGLPAGGELDYIDDATLGQALRERTIIYDKEKNK